MDYDKTVRSSTKQIVQFQYGDDGLDPAMMEAKSGAVIDFDHVLEHITNTVEFVWFQFPSFIHNFAVKFFVLPDCVFVKQIIFYINLFG